MLERVVNLTGSILPFRLGWLSGAPLVPAVRTTPCGAHPGDAATAHHEISGPMLQQRGVAVDDLLHVIEPALWAPVEGRSTISIPRPMRNVDPVAS
jgi:hypothetical protein